VQLGKDGFMDARPGRVALDLESVWVVLNGRAARPTLGPFMVSIGHADGLEICDCCFSGKLVAASLMIPVEV